MHQNASDFCHRVSGHASHSEGLEDMFLLANHLPELLSYQPLISWGFLLLFRWVDRVEHKG